MVLSFAVGVGVIDTLGQRRFGHSDSGLAIWGRCLLGDPDFANALAATAGLAAVVARSGQLGRVVAGAVPLIIVLDIANRAVSVDVGATDGRAAGCIGGPSRSR